MFSRTTTPTVVFSITVFLSEIPEWFCDQGANRSSGRISPLPTDLFDNPDWMGFSFCNVFSFHKFPTAVREKLDSGISHTISYRMKCNSGFSALQSHGISEDNVLISLHKGAFIWVSFIPRCALSRQWSECTWIEFMFQSCSPDVTPLNCGAKLVYNDNFDGFIRTVVQCHIEELYLIRSSSCREDATVYERLPFYHDIVSGNDGSYPRFLLSQGETSGTSGQYSCEDLPFSQRETSWTSVQYPYEEPCDPFIKTSALVRFLYYLCK